MARQIFQAGVERVLPHRLICSAMSVQSHFVRINDLELDLDLFRNIFVIGAGKASALMGAAVEGILGERISGGHIVVKKGHGCSLKRIRITEASHPVPDAAGFAATAGIIELARAASADDLVICLLSGGGSALLADYPGGSSPGEIMAANELLVKCGATINEINTVRKHLSLIKGGQLARIVFPGTTVSLILSDVTGDPLDVIASGPTVPDPTNFSEALGILGKYGLRGSFPAGLIEFLERGAGGGEPETPKPADPVFERTFNILVGNNRLALEAAYDKAVEYGLRAEIITDSLEGDVADVAGKIVAQATGRSSSGESLRPVCLLFGGEPTVCVNGAGVGGRNQHLALLCSVLLRGSRGITVLSAGTDGSDGPTTAAGAVIDCSTYEGAVSMGIDPGYYLAGFDSFIFFSRAGGHVITGPTMTNVMDIIVVLVE